MDESQDQPMVDGTPNASHLPLSDTENKALELYERLQELRLEVAMINAQRSLSQNASADTSPEATKAAQDELLDAKAKYTLRNEVVEAVMSTTPILKAVHHGTDASAIERDLLPYVERRDQAAVSVMKQVNEQWNRKSEITRLQSEALRRARQNVEITKELFELADEDEKTAGRTADPKLQQELEKAEQQMRASRQRWKVIKGLASGVVVGSGMDWARDATLLDMVLEPEDEK